MDKASMTSGASSITLVSEEKPHRLSSLFSSKGAKSHRTASSTVNDPPSSNDTNAKTERRKSRFASLLEPRAKREEKRVLGPEPKENYTVSRRYLMDSWTMTSSTSYANAEGRDYGFEVYKSEEKPKTKRAGNTSEILPK